MNRTHAFSVSQLTSLTIAWLYWKSHLTLTAVVFCISCGLPKSLIFSWAAVGHTSLTEGDTSVGGGPLPDLLDRMDRVVKAPPELVVQVGVDPVVASADSHQNLFCSILDCVLSLQEVALRQSLPPFSVLCYPYPYRSLLPHSVISPTFWSFIRSYTLYLPPCVSNSPSVIFHPGSVSCPFHQSDLLLSGLEVIFLTDLWINC